MNTSNMLEQPHLNMHRIDTSNFQTIRDQWEEAAGADEFEVVYGNAFDAMKDDLQKVGFNVPIHACLCVENSTEVGSSLSEVEAILELTDTRLGQMTKLATVRLAPKFIDWEATHSSRKEVMKVYSRALAHLITLGQTRAEQGKHTVKIYGRNSGLFTLLKEIANGWDEIAEATPEFDSTATMEGRWLKIDLEPLTEQTT